MDERQFVPIVTCLLITADRSLQLREFPRMGAGSNYRVHISLMYPNESMDTREFRQCGEAMLLDGTKVLVMHEVRYDQ